MDLLKFLFSLLLLDQSVSLSEVHFSDEMESSVSLLQMAAKKRMQTQHRTPLDGVYLYYDGVAVPNGYQNYCGLFADIHVSKIFDPPGGMNNAGVVNGDFNDLGGVFPMAQTVDGSVEMQAFSCPGAGVTPTGERVRATSLTNLQGLAVKVDGDIIEVHFKPMDLTHVPAVALANATISDFFDRARALCAHIVDETELERALSYFRTYDWSYYEDILGKPAGYYAANMWEGVHLENGRANIFHECDTKAVQRDYSIWINGVEQPGASAAAPTTKWYFSESGKGNTPTFPIPGTNDLQWSQAGPGSNAGGEAVRGKTTSMSMFKKGTPGSLQAKMVFTVIGSYQSQRYNDSPGGLPRCQHCPPPARDSFGIGPLKPSEGGMFMIIPALEFGLWINPHLTGGPLPTDGRALCNAGFHPQRYPRAEVPSEKVLFSAGARQAMCEVCTWPGPPTMPRTLAGGLWFNASLLLPHCHTPPVPPTPTPPPPPPEVCREVGVDILDAEEACKKLVGDSVLYGDCLIDYCESGGNEGAAALDELEEHSKVTTTEITDRKSVV